MVSSPGFNSPGTNLNRLMDSLGFADKLGDLMGAQLDAAVGNNLGVARNLFDAFSGLSTGQVDKMMAGGFPGAGFINRPHEGYGHHFGCSKHTHYEREQISTFNMGPLGLGGSGAMIDGKRVDIGKQNKNMSPAQLESKIQGDPALRHKIEQQLGGRIVYDGNADGRITVAKQQHHPLIPFHNHIQQHCGNMLGRCFQPPMLNNMLGNLGNFLNQTGFGAGMRAGFGAGFGAGMAVGAGLQGLLGGRQAGQAGQAGQSGQAGQAGASDGTSPSDILKNPNMSFEQKLAMFMFAFMEKKQKELNEKMEALDKKQQGGQAGQGGPGQAGGGGKKGGGGKSGKKGGGSPLGKIGGLAGSVLQIGGGAIGGMYGGPIGAAMGGQIGGMAGNMLQGVTGGGGAAGGAGGAGGAQGGAQGAGGKGDGSDSIEMKKLEQAMQEMNKIFTLVDNMLKSMNDVVKQGPLAGIRG